MGAGAGFLASPIFQTILGAVATPSGGDAGAGARAGLQASANYDRTTAATQILNNQTRDQDEFRKWLMANPPAGAPSEQYAPNVGIMGMPQPQPAAMPPPMPQPMMMPPQQAPASPMPAPPMPAPQAPPRPAMPPPQAAPAAPQAAPQAMPPQAAPQAMPPPQPAPQVGAWQGMPRAAPTAQDYGPMFQEMMKYPSTRAQGLQGMLALNTPGAETWRPLTGPERAGYPNLPPGQMAQISDRTGQVRMPGAPMVSMTTGDGGMKATDALRYVNDKGEHPPAGMTRDEAEASGYKLTSTAKQTEKMGKESAMRVIDKLEELATGKDGVFSDVDPGMAALASRGEFAWQGVMQEDPRYRTYLGYSEATVAPLIRALGEKGTLATEDVARAFGLIPRPGDTTEVARMKINNLKALFAEKGVKGFKAKSSPSPKSSGGEAVLQFDPATGKAN